MAIVTNQDIPYRTLLYKYDDEYLYLGPKYREELQEAIHRPGYPETVGIVSKSLRGARPTFRSPKNDLP